ncbi:MAG TPA: energy-coupling factor ABC transporter permease, partial [Candidatus Humimicrobiaceae bacterium]
TAIELAVSGTYTIGLTLSSMVIIHMIIGLGEAAITVIVIAFIDKVKPDLILTRNWNRKVETSQIVE